MDIKKKKNILKPIVKWVGGKGQLVEEIAQLYPKGLGRTINKYAEPFVGGGAVLFDLLNKYELDSIYISDINSELINVYCQIRDNVETVIAFLNRWKELYLPLNDERRKDFYYEKRKRFNELICIANDYLVEKAALFIFLNRTCFNGLFRVNKKGLFNVPIGAYKVPLICDEDNLRAVSLALEKVEIVCADYRESREYIDEHTFVYFDPPYRPLNETSNFVSYTSVSFDDNAQIDLAKYVQELTLARISVLVSNSDPKNIDENDLFFDDLYKSQIIKRICANRAINSVGNSRGKISELLIYNYSLN